MQRPLSGCLRSRTRRAFFKKGIAAGVAAAGVSLFTERDATSAPHENNKKLTRGDAAMLRFAAAAEIIESDLWNQYNELGGVPDPEVPGGSGNAIYTSKLTNLDDDFPIYIHDNTDDEISHASFINAYLVAKGAEPANLEAFRTLPGSTATGSSGQPRLTNLTELTVDTSWWTRYRSSASNPDLNPAATFPQAVPGLNDGKFTAIPRTNSDLSPDRHIQAIANTAVLHMATIEQGGTSLYPAMAQRATSTEVLRIMISIGPTETMHFQTWSDKAGAALSRPLAPLTDPTNGLTFPDLNSAPFDGEDFSTNLIMPEPCPFLSPDLPKCSIIRPTETQGIAMGVVNFLAAMGLFSGQSDSFFELMTQLAAEADAATRKG